MVSIGLRTKPKLEDVIRALKEEFEGRTNAGFSSVLLTAERKAREEAPSRSGRLMNSIRWRLDTPLKGSLTAAAPYASFLHEGTGIYGTRRKKIIIRPRHRTALSWQGAGHPFRKVVQEGIRPVNFMTEALKERLIESAFIKGFQT